MGTPLLKDIALAIEPVEPPFEVRRFLREAERRIERFQIDCRVPGFVPCDFNRMYAALASLRTAQAAPGDLFCEWGSGFGVVTCLAAMLDFDAWGIEYNAALVEESRRLAADFDVPAQFQCGSYIPPGSESCFDAKDAFSWLELDATWNEEEAAFEPDDFDVIFAYPWPDEERFVERLFLRHARPGALLVTHWLDKDVTVQRKVARRWRS